MTAANDHYDILMIGPDATPTMIRAAFRAAIQRHHPDHSCANDANARAASIIDAYRVLSDPDRRRGYDRRRASVRIPSHGPERRTIDRRRSRMLSRALGARTTLAKLWAISSTAIVCTAFAPLAHQTEDLPDRVVRQIIVAAPNRVG